MSTSRHSLLGKDPLRGHAVANARCHARNLAGDTDGGCQPERERPLVALAIVRDDNEVLCRILDQIDVGIAVRRLCVAPGRSPSPHRRRPAVVQGSCGLAGVRPGSIALALRLPDHRLGNRAKVLKLDADEPARCLNPFVEAVGKWPGGSFDQGVMGHIVLALEGGFGRLLFAEQDGAVVALARSGRCVVALWQLSNAQRDRRDRQAGTAAALGAIRRRGATGLSSANVQASPRRTRVRCLRPQRHAPASHLPQWPPPAYPFPAA